MLTMALEYCILHRFEVEDVFFFPPRFLSDGERVHIESKELFNICMSASGMSQSGFENAILE